MPCRTVTLEPPTQMSPSSSSTDTRPSRPSAVPCRATYRCGIRPLPMSHCASAAFSDPVTGSSVERPAVAGEEGAHLESASRPAGAARRRRCPCRRAAQGPGRSASTSSAEPQQHRAPRRAVVAPRVGHDVVAGDAAGRGDRARRPRPSAAAPGSGGAANARRPRRRVAADRHEAHAALLDDRRRPSVRRRPPATRGTSRASGGRRTAARGRGRRSAPRSRRPGAWAAAGTSPRTGSSSR